MTVKERWTLAAAIGLPFLAMTAYLVLVWPRPAGNSMIAETAPYVLSLLTGVPFVLRLTRRSGRGLFLLAFLAGGLVLLWVYALAVLCGMRGMCL